MALAHNICMVFLRKAVTRAHPALFPFPFSQRRKEAKPRAAMAPGSHSKSGQGLLASYRAWGLDLV